MEETYVLHTAAVSRNKLERHQFNGLSGMKEARASAMGERSSSLG